MDWPTKLLRYFELYPATDPMAPAFRARQLQAVLAMTPWTMAANVLNAALVCITFWNSADPWLLSGWAALIVAAAFMGLLRWRRPSRPTASPRALRRATVQATALALLWGWMTLLLFPTAERSQQLLLATLVTGMMSAGGFALTTLPVAGTLWVAVLTLASSASLVLADFPLAAAVNMLLVIYAFILGSSIWTHARAFCLRLSAEAKADAANRAKSIFLSSMSHELRTPLNAVLGYAQLLSTDPNLDQETRTSAGEIETAGLHLLALVNDLLDLARIESGKLDLHLEAVDLSQALAEVRRALEPLAQKHAVSLDIPHLPIHLQADPLRLRQVLLNLASNGVKYNRPHGQVLVRGEPQAGARYRIRVEDTGPGIAADRLGELFQSFNRIGAERGTIEGTGIGLVIARNLVEAMDGAIGVESTPGAGSCFWVELPLASHRPG